VHPLEVVSRGMMVTHLPASAVLRHVVATRGVLGLWAGMGQRTAEGLVGLALMVGVGLLRQRPASKSGGVLVHELGS